MYGVGTYKYPYPIRALPQLPTANARLKPPGLSGCGACGGMGATDTSSAGWFLALGIGVILFGLLTSHK